MPPKIEFNISLKIFDNDILKSHPIIIKPTTQAVIIIALFTSKVIPPFFNKYESLWTNMIN